MVASARAIHGEDQIAKMSEIHQFSADELNHLKILHSSSPDETMLKRFRDLRTQLYSHAGNRNFVCLVTSVCTQGGASHVSRNLAAAIALDRTKTAALVDCNFYSPSAAELLSAEINVGLADYLNKRSMGIEQIVYASGMSRVRVIPAGKDPQASTERMATGKMQEFVQEIKARYADRYVIVDSPSITEFPADVRILSQACDFVVLVVPYGKVTGEQVQESIRAIGLDRLAGVIFNRI